MEEGVEMEEGGGGVDVGAVAELEEVGVDCRGGGGGGGEEPGAGLERGGDGEGVGEGAGAVEEGVEREGVAEAAGVGGGADGEDP